MAASKYKVGDVVKLNSGGPALTVTALYPEATAGPSVRVAWFVNPYEKLHEETIHQDALIPHAVG